MLAGGVLGAQMGDTVKPPMAYTPDVAVSEQVKLSDKAFDTLFNDLAAKRNAVVINTPVDKLDEALDERADAEKDAFRRFALSNASEAAFANVLRVAKANNITYSGINLSEIKPAALNECRASDGNDYNDAMMNGENILECTVNADKPVVTAPEELKIFLLTMIGGMAGYTVNIATGQAGLSAGQKPQRRRKINN
jgi:hypothetical protein